MKKIVISGFAIASMVLLSACSISREREDSIKLEGMMPKEDNKTIDAMMKKTEANTMEKNNAMMKKEDTMMKKDDSAMMKKETVGVYTPYADSLVKSSLVSGKNVILFFHAKWCPTCKAADTNFLKETVPANTIVLKVDYDMSAELKKKYGVTSQHTFVSLNADESLKKKSSGATHFSDLAQLN